MILIDCVFVGFTHPDICPTCSLHIDRAASVTVISFWYVFSDYKEGDDISLHLEGSQKLLESQTLDIGAEV